MYDFIDHDINGKLPAYVGIRNRNREVYSNNKLYSSSLIFWIVKRLVYTEIYQHFQVPDADIKSCRNYTDFSGKVFVNPVGNEKDRKLYSQYNLRKMEQEQ